MKKVLVIRTDRLGDVILSTPCFDCFEKVTIVAWVQPLFWPLLKTPHFMLDPHQSLFILVQQLREQKFDAVFVLNTQWKILLACFLAGIPQRFGAYVKWYHVLFFTKGIRQKRSKGQKHETEYSLDIMRLGKIPLKSHLPLSIQLPDFKPFHTWFIKKPILHQKKFVAIHPGMGGSALNWPLHSYIHLIKTLLNDTIPVIVTGGPHELNLMDQIRLAIQSPLCIIYKASQTQMPIAFLGHLLQKAQVMVAPSTGPLHLAAALGIPTVAIYAPLVVQSAKRWGPFVSPQKAHVFTPNVVCPEKFHCQGPRCPYYDCMESIPVTMIANAVKDYFYGS